LPDVLDVRDEGPVTTAATVGRANRTKGRGTESLLESRLTPPRADGLVVRPRLLANLDRTPSSRLTLVCAPAGFGKTSLLATWAAGVRQPLAWVTLDGTSGDPTRFWSYLAAAVERARPGVGLRAAKLIRARGRSLDIAVNELLADLERAAPMAIVLDDLHVVDDEACLVLLGRAIERLPAGVRVVASTRADPTQLAGRLRGLGLLDEIRARELAFTADEARQLLVERSELDLGPDEISLLVQRTEGWPVALSLAALWLGEQDDPRRHTREFAADNRFVIEYLTSEILDALEPSARDFLVRTSVLQMLSAPLCDAVLERSDSDERLDELARSSELLLPGDRRGGWFRCHALVRDLLRLELDRDHGDSVSQLHLRAAAWYAKHDLPTEAVEHALDASSPSAAADILGDAYRALIQQGECARFLRLAERLPAGSLLGHPELTAGAAQATYLAQRPAYERARWLTLTERSRTESPRTWTLRAESTASIARAVAVDGNLGDAMAHARHALELSELLGDHEGELPALAALAYVHYLRDETDAAWKHATRAVASPEAPRRPHSMVRALGTLALLAAERGHMAEAQARIHEALTLSDELGLSASASVYLAHLAAGRSLTDSGRLMEAQSAVKHAERLSRTPDPNAAHTHCLLALAEVQLQRGRALDAAASLEQAAAEIQTFSDSGKLPARLARDRRRLRAARSSTSATTEPLSPAELSVLRLLPTDLSQRDIGRRLFLSVNTIKTHTRSIYQKLGVGTREGAVLQASALGLLENGDSPG
jgi:LuxR family maltose regulon positive regulatory protein